jgi:hypothetical protein
MKLAGIIFVLTVGLLALVGVTSLIQQRKLTLGFGVAWFITIGGLMLVVALPPARSLWISLSTSLFDSSPYLISLTLFLLVFLLGLSVAVSRLSRQVREISQFISLENSQNREHSEDQRD